MAQTCFRFNRLLTSKTIRKLSNSRQTFHVEKSVRTFFGGGFFSRFWTSKPAAQKVSVDIIEPPPACREWPIKYTLVDTCDFMWMEKLDGMKFSTGYIDTKTSSTAIHSGPTVLLLHGTPGSHRDFLPLIETLDEKGIRVIAVNFPGFGITKSALLDSDDEEVFGQTTEEKTSFILDFLSVLNMKRKNSFDMILGQGTASMVAMNLLLETNNEGLFKSLALLSPMPTCLPKQYGEQKKLQQLSSWWDTAKLKPFVSQFIEHEFPVMSLRSDDHNAWGQALRTIAAINFTDVRAHCFSMDVLPHPILTMCSRDDPYCEPELVKESLDIMGIGEMMMNVYDHKGTVIKKGNSHNINGKYRKCLDFTEGGHYLQDKYSAEITTEVMTVLDLVRTGSHSKT